MMTYYRVDPCRPLNGLQREVDKMLGHLAIESPRTAAATRIGEDTHNRYLEIEAPGLSPESLDVTVTDSVLEITAKHAESVGEEAAISWSGAAPRTGEFARRFKLADDVDSARIGAAYRQGVLRVTMPKAEAAKPRRIEIQTS